MDSASLDAQQWQDGKVKSDTMDLDDVFGGHLGFFNTEPKQATEAPQTFFQDFTLPLVDFSSSGSEEDLPEPSILEARHKHADQASIRSLPSESSDDDSTDDLEGNSGLDQGIRDGKYREAPTLLVSAAALKDIWEFLHGRSKGKGGGHHQPDLDPFLRSRMEGMRVFLSLYTDSQSATQEKWAASSLQAAVTLGHGTYCAQQLCNLARAYIVDRNILPLNPYGDWNESMLVDEDLCADVNLYLQELGNKITAEKLVTFLSRPEIKEKHGIMKNINIRTARCYLNALGFRFTHAKKGQYSDGHEREDIVHERTTVFIPKWKALETEMRNWKRDNILQMENSLPASGKWVVVWFHGETIFYANNRRRLTWYHKDADAKPYAKGDGASLMIAHVISANYGFLEDGTRTARRLLKPGKNRDGYFTNNNILEQFREMVSIAKSKYPDDHHIFVYDNATTHLKCPENAPSARHMPKFTPKPGNNWLVDVTKCTPDGRPVRRADGTIEKVKARMADTKFNGQIQSLYFPEGHPCAGVFKGTQVILEERGQHEIAKKKAQCKDFKCPPGIRDCCCRRFLYTKPDFTHGESNLEILAKELGVEVMFLPKFHCEINPIKQCWGYAKRIYRFNPESPREDQLEKNALEALSQISLSSIRK